MLEEKQLSLTGQSTDFLFTNEQLKWLSKARAFADALSLEDILGSDRDNKFRRDLFEKACREGFGALPFPKDFGGTGGDYVSFCLVNEEFGRRVVPIMSSLGVHVLCQEPVYRFGTDAQKERYLRPSASGAFLAAFGLTEPQAGSDAANLETKARLEGDHYVLNGTKVFITSGASADYFIVMAKLQDLPEYQSNPPKSITSFIVEKDAPGFQIGQKFDLMGMRGYSTCEIVFNECRIKKENILGQPGMGRKVALSSLAKGRVTIAAQSIGWAQGALDGIIDHYKKLLSEGLADKHLGGMANLVGELACLVESARVLTYQAAIEIDKGGSNVTLAAMAKTQATDCAMKVASEAIAIVGAEAGTPNLLLERIYRDAKAGQIYEGTNQIQRHLIARQLLS